MKKSTDTTRSNDRKLRLIATGNLLIRKIAISLFATAILFAVAITAEEVIVSEAQEGILERADIETSYSDINKVIGELIETIAGTEDSLHTVKEMKFEDNNKEINQMFEDLKVKVNKTLNALSPNSTLIDNLEGAKVKMVMFKRWFERQPAGYRMRDQLIMRLDKVIKGYDESAEAIQSGRKVAQDALSALVRDQFLTSMEQKVRTAEYSVDMTKRLVATLEAASKKLREVAEREKGIPAISN